MTSAHLPRRVALPRFQHRCALRSLDIDVSPYLLSTTQSPEVVEEAFEMGINFFLLAADFHWPQYESTRIGLQRLLRRPNVRDKIVVAAMSYVHLPNGAATAFREVLNAVPELRKLDILIIGGANNNNFLPRIQDYRAYIEDGCVGARRTGACIDDYQTLMMARDAYLVDFALTPFNAMRRKSADALLAHQSRSNGLPLYSIGSAFEYRTEEELLEIGLPANKWRPSRADHYRFVMTWKAFDGTMISWMSSDGLRELEGSIEKGPLDDIELDYLVDLGDLVSGRARLAEDPPA